MKSILTLACAITAVLALSSSGSIEAAGKQKAAAKPVAASAQAGLKSDLTPGERGQLARAFVLKWGPYVQQVYGVDVGTWAKRMVGSFAHSDATNFQRALQRSTYEGALAQLGGTGNRRSDAKVINAFAAANSLDPTLLGDDNLDLVYTPITPCRIVDTRNAGGPIAGQTTRDFKAWGVSDYLAQGGSATDCGLFGESPSAAVLNVTAVGPTGAGYATVFPYGGAQPFIASVNYVLNEDVNNSITTPLAAGVPVFDFTIFTYAEADYVVDIVGYYDAPHATALDCTASDLADTDVGPFGSFNLHIPNCPSGYSTTGASCHTQGTGEANWSRTGLFNGGGGNAFCSGVNTTGGTIKVGGARACCRVPGR